MSKKSGLVVLKTGDILFHDGEVAKTLYIIQKGQLRLFKPKGKGFIEIAVLRAGEVIGEMAYFENESGVGGTRSCSAKAIAPTEVIEISFDAFSKTLEALNPWFKTIIKTMADRLRKSNKRVREMESNSVTYTYGANEREGKYEFFREKEVVRMLSMLFLVMKGHGEKDKDGVAVHMNTLQFYAFEVFNILESKYEVFLDLLKVQGILENVKGEDDSKNVLLTKNLDNIRGYLLFFNSQITLPEDKKLRISEKCQTFMESIWEQIRTTGQKDPRPTVDLSLILNYYKERNQLIDLPDLEEAMRHGFVTEPIVAEGNLVTCEVDLEKLKKLMPKIRLMNAILKYNRRQRD